MHATFATSNIFLIIDFHSQPTVAATVIFGWTIVVTAEGGNNVT